MEKRLAELKALKDKHIAAAAAGNPPDAQEVIELRQLIRAVETAISATERVAVLDAAFKLKNKPQPTVLVGE